MQNYNMCIKDQRKKTITNSKTLGGHNKYPIYNNCQNNKMMHCKKYFVVLIRGVIKQFVDCLYKSKLLMVLQ